MTDDATAVHSNDTPETDALTDLPEGTPPLEGLAMQRALEALLFAADRPVPIPELQKVLVARKKDVEEALTALGQSLGERGVRLQRNGEDVQMVTAPDVAIYVERFFGIGGTQKLSQAAIETLAVIAYHQPVTRAQIEAIRGVSADYAVNVLQARGLIMETGRLATAGRPALFGTTMEFLQYLGISSLDELPHPEIRHPAQSDMFEALEMAGTQPPELEAAPQSDDAV
jgi:segregation and condensation protein B